MCKLAKPVSVIIIRAETEGGAIKFNAQEEDYCYQDDAVLVSKALVKSDKPKLWVEATLNNPLQNRF